MPRAKYINSIGLGDDGKWHITLKGRTYSETYGSLDDAVDHILLEETLACARVAAEMSDEYEERVRAARDDEDILRCSAAAAALDAAAHRIRARAKQELAPEEGLA